MKKKVLAAVLAAVMAVGMLAGCGNGGSGDAGSADSDGGNGSDSSKGGTYVYEQTVLNKEEVEIPTYNFGGNTMLANMMRAQRVELTLADDDTFTLEAHGWMQEDTEGSAVAVGEAFAYGDGMYAEYFTSASGTYEKDGNAVTITPTEVTYEIPDLGVSYLAQLFTMGTNAGGGSFNPEGEDYFGKWSSTDVPEVLKLVPVTVFTLDGDAIKTWERGDTLVVAEGDHASIVFYGDGTARYNDSENGLTEEMEWTLEGEQVTISYGETTVVAGADTAVEITIKKYSDATTFTEYTQSITLTADDIAALQ